MAAGSSVTRDDVLRAIAQVRSGVAHLTGPPGHYILHHDGETFAPRAVLSIAARSAAGRTSTTSDVKDRDAGRRAHHVLRELGFTVTAIKDRDSPSDCLAGYILLAKPAWLDKHKRMSVGRTAIYARGAGAPMKSVSRGAPVFCMRNGEMPRRVHLWGTFRDSRQLSVDEAWDLHGERLAASRDEFRSQVSHIDSIRDRDQLTAVQLDSIAVPPEPIPLEAVGVAVSPHAVKGESLDPRDVARILEYVGSTPDSWIAGEFDLDELKGFEGRRQAKRHVRIERDRQLVGRAKRSWLRRDPKLHCKVCRESMVDRYGELAVGFIEAHHIKPLGELAEERITTIKGLAPVCPNCHRMLHRARCSIQELRRLLRSTS